MKLTNEYYDKFLELKERVKNKDFKSTNEFITPYQKSILSRMGVYKFDVKNGYTFKDIGIIEFNELLSKVKKEPIIYVFDNDFNLIYADYNYRHLSRLFGNSQLTILRRLERQNFKSANYYYSYDKNFSKKNITCEKRSILSEDGRKKLQESNRIRAIASKKRFKKIAKELLEDEQLLTKSAAKIGEKYNVSHKAVYNWFNEKEEFKEVVIRRNQLINKIKTKLETDINKIKKNKTKIGSISNSLKSNQTELESSDLIALGEYQNKPIKRLGKYGSKEALQKALGIKINKNNFAK